LFLGRNAPIQLQNTVGAQVGDQVELVIADEALLRQSIWAYGVPLTGFFIGALLAQASLHHELAALLGALVGMSCGWWLTRRFAIIKKPEIQRILTRGKANEMD
jgi:sigma-E factor negative regulatory protein RseC